MLFCPVFFALLFFFSFFFFFSSRRRHTRLVSVWSSDVCSSDLHFVIVVVEILRFESAATVLAFIYDLFVDQRGWSMRQIEFCDDQTRGFGCQIRVLL